MQETSSKWKTYWIVGFPLGDKLPQPKQALGSELFSSASLSYATK